MAAFDPTYEIDKINTNPEWELAFVISEVVNDEAPIGWAKYIPVAQSIINHYKGRERPFTKEPS